MKIWTATSSLISWKGIQDLTSVMCAGLFATVFSLDRIGDHEDKTFWMNLLCTYLSLRVKEDRESRFLWSLTNELNGTILQIAILNFVSTQMLVSYVLLL
jgi:hypothetical protein